jgi:DNA-binding transcriptional LysR family regulator
VEIDIRHLRLLVAVADEGSLTGAARVLGHGQPAVSRQLGRIEEALGGPVFVRSPIGVEATELGAAVLRSARSILGRLDGLGPPAVAVPPRVSVRTFVLPFELFLPLLGPLVPDVTWEVRSGGLADGLDAVAAGRADLFLGLRWETTTVPPGLVVDELVHERSWALLPAGHPAAARPSVLLRSLAGETFASRPEPELHRALLRGCRRAGFEPDVRFRVVDDTALRAVVGSGAGVALTSPLADVDDRVTLRPCPDAQGHTWVLVHRDGCFPAPVLRLLADLVRWGYAFRARGNSRLHDSLAPELLSARFPSALPGGGGPASGPGSTA